jgi:hypothetical protein
MTKKTHFEAVTVAHKFKKKIDPLLHVTLDKKPPRDETRIYE